MEKTQRLHIYVSYYNKETACRNVYHLIFLTIMSKLQSMVYLFQATFILVAILSRVIKKQADDTILQEITEFEIITALAYDYFCQQEVDVVIMEVGLGGLLDWYQCVSTGLTAITTIGLDHTAIFGF